MSEKDAENHSCAHWPGEKDWEYEFFLRYARSDPPRRLTMFGPARCTKYNVAWRLSAKNHWRERITLWDQELAAAEYQAMLKEHARIGKEHAKAAGMMRELGSAELRSRVREFKDRDEAKRLNSDLPHPSVLSDRDMTVMLNDGIKLERELLKEAAQAIAPEMVETMNFSALTTDELATYLALTAKLEASPSSATIPDLDELEARAGVDVELDLDTGEDEGDVGTSS